MTPEHFQVMGLKRARLITDIRVNNAPLVLEGTVRLLGDDLVEVVRNGEEPQFVQVKSIIAVIRRK